MLLGRQRLLLTLLDVVDRPVTHLDFQKLLFFYTREWQPTPRYDFVPYKFGAFSFTSYADKRRLIALGLLADDDQYWRLTEAGRAAAQQHGIERAQVTAFWKRYRHIRGEALLIEQYRRFPYYAARSEILEQLALDQETLARIEALRPKRGPAGLITLGYEGRSLDGFINELLRVGVTLLCDVRKNAISKKYGFSKATLINACMSMGIRYVHMPELGVPSDQRRRLSTAAELQALFAWYRHNVLASQQTALEQILRWIGTGERVALMCFERDPEQCHRHCIAEALQWRSGAVHF
ncbi:MAG: DUF488 domain-containing protein [Verrucomicrobiae bacterium]|nr:DUF488 domain-containing protein [Verrucomicrobiae bacterium]MDW7981128.1 DUF488 domain-containing protein [Verrucomicrobiales bacterium]